MKLTKPQRRFLARLARYPHAVSPFTCGYPKWNFVARLRDAGLVTVVGERWPVQSADSYEITQHGREAIQ